MKYAGISPEKQAWLIFGSGHGYDTSQLQSRPDHRIISHSHLLRPMFQWLHNMPSSMNHLIFCNHHFFRIYGIVVHILKSDKHIPSTTTNFNRLISTCYMSMKVIKFVVVDGICLSVCNHVLFVVQEVTKSKILLWWE